MQSQLLLVALALALLAISVPTTSANEKPGEPDISAKAKHTDKDGHHNAEFDHEAVTGSHKEAEEFKDLTPEESKKRLTVLIGRMDSDGNGKIDKNELTNWIVNSFKKLDREDAASKMEEHDENDDKKVTWGEYLHKAYGYKEEELKEFEKDKSPDMISFMQMLEEDKRKFNLADQNHDGALDLDEYTYFSHPHNYDVMAPVEIDKTMKDYDKNKDGFIDEKEFMGEDKMDPETSKAESEHFKQYDKNGDGKLDKDEVKGWTMPKFDDSAATEADHLIKESDKDKDGVLTKDEILGQHELWVGSQATDYGKHLDDLKKEEL